MIILSDLPKDKFGVYSIRNKVNGRVYVGSTRNSFYKRFHIHLKHLRNSKHHSKELQKDWNTYGEDAFYVVVEKVLSDINLVIPLEQNYLNFMFSLCDDYYNSCPDATSTKGRKRTKEEKDMLSSIVRGKMQNPEVKRKMSEAQKRRWKDPEYQKEVSARSAKIWENGYRKRKEHNGLVSPEGIIYERINNMSDFCKLHNLNIAGIFQIMSGTQNKHRGWIYIGPVKGKKYQRKVA